MRLAHRRDCTDLRSVEAHFAHFTALEHPQVLVGLFLFRSFSQTPMQSRHQSGGSVRAIWLQPWSNVNARAWATGF